MGLVHQHYSSHSGHLQQSPTQGAQTRLDVGYFARYSYYRKLVNINVMQSSRRSFAAKRCLSRTSRQEPSSSDGMASQCTTLMRHYYYYCSQQQQPLPVPLSINAPWNTLLFRFGRAPEITSLLTTSSTSTALQTLLIISIPATVTVNL